MDLSVLAHQLKTHLNFEQLPLNDGENTQLIFDHIIINAEVLSGSTALFFYVNYGTLHHIPLAQRNQWLLNANYFTHETLGASFGINPNTDDIVLSKRVDLSGLNSTDFLRYFDDFYKSCEYWQKQFGEHTTNQSDQQHSQKIEGAIYA